MEEVSLTGIKTMLLKLDIKQNTDKTLTDLMRQLQLSSTFKGIVTELTQEGDAIFTTKLGKFSLPNIFGLNKNDKIIIKNVFEGDKLLSQLIAINDTKTEKTTPISLSFFANSAPNLSTNKFGSPIEVNINNSPNIDRVVTGNLSYANLANLNRKSLLFKLFEKAPQNAVIEFKIHKQGDIKTPNPYQIIAEIVEDKNQQQTIKTPFGILKVPTTNMSVGSRFILEIKSINNLNVDNAPLKTIVENLLFKLNTNWPTLNSLFSEVEDTEVMQLALKNNYPNNPNSKPSMQLPTPPSSMLDAKPASLEAIFNDKNNPLLLNPNNNDPRSPNVSSKNINHLQQEINSFSYKQNPTKKSGSVNSSAASPRLNDEAKKIIPKTIHEKEVINELKNELSNFKNSLYPAAKNENNYWHQIFWPFPKNQEIEDEQILFKHVSKNIIRFIIEISLSEFGDIQFDGLVTLKDQDFVENFDLAVRFKSKIDKNLQSTISDIYLLNQSSIGFKGKLNFESVTEFNVKD